ncbi:hypothetical protein M422DRAFT_164900, partial [Sphaerobolus stellatus SS14]
SSLRAPTPVACATCSDVTVVFARGTFKAEPIRTIVGLPFKAASLPTNSPHGRGQWPVVATTTHGPPVVPW